MELVAKSIYYDFPNFPNRRLSLGDACPTSGACSGHPGNSHGTREAVDTNYYTLGETNTTQYRPGVRGDKTYDTITKIWTRPPDKGKLNELFDWKRNLMLVLRLRQIFPDLHIHTQRQIKALLRDKAKELYGSDVYALVSRCLTGDSACRYSHDRHFHISMRDKINWDFDVKNFYK